MRGPAVWAARNEGQSPSALEAPVCVPSAVRAALLMPAGLASAKEGRVVWLERTTSHRRPQFCVADPNSCIDKDGLLSQLLELMRYLNQNLRTQRTDPARAVDSGLHRFADCLRKSGPYYSTRMWYLCLLAEHLAWTATDLHAETQHAACEPQCATPDPRPLAPPLRQPSSQ